MLAPIQQLLFGKDYLRLRKQEVAIFYETFRSHNQADMQTLIDRKLAPGEN